MAVRGSKSRLNQGASGLLVVIVALALLAAGRVQAQRDQAVGATFTVNSTADALDASPGDGICASAAGECTLRAAVLEANALPGADTILLPASTYTLTVAGADENYAATGDLDLYNTLTIQGAGAEATIIDGNGSVLHDRVFDARDKEPKRITGVTITNGEDDGAGGGIYTHSDLTLRNSVIRNNTSFHSGGGIFNDRNTTLTLINTTISDNTAHAGRWEQGGGGIANEGTVSISDSVISDNFVEFGRGGGLYNKDSYSSGFITDSIISGNSSSTDDGGGIFNNGDLTIDRSTIADNSSGDYGGGIYNFGYTLYVSNSTISGNTAAGSGGIYNNGYLTLLNATVSGNTATGSIGGVRTSAYPVWISNSTITGNTAADIGGLYVSSGDVNMQNTIVANNTATTSPDCYGTVTSWGFNLVGQDTGCDFQANQGDQVGTADDPLDPLLGPLQDNGGPTLTHALLPGSPALESGNPNGCTDDQGNLVTADQRGFIRPVDGDYDGQAICDSGAYEFASAARPGFTLAAVPPTASACMPADALYDVTVNPLVSFDNPVRLKASDQPAGTSATFSPNSVIPPGTSQLTIGDTGLAAPGRYTIQITGMAPTMTHSTTVTLILAAAIPSAPGMLTPANGAEGQPLRPTFTWTASTEVMTYTLEIATDPAFNTIVYTADVTGTNHTPTSDLSCRARYYWRVTARNACGATPASAVFTFTTLLTDFSLAASPLTQSLCAPAEADYDITLSGYSPPVTLSAAGYPVGATAAFDANPVLPPGSSVLTIGNTGAAVPGSYTIEVTGTFNNRSHATEVGLNLYTTPPGSPTLLLPPDEAVDQSLRPTFTWSAAAQGERYEFQLATDSGFTDIVDSATGLTATSYIPTLYLQTETIYYWRVQATNSCGVGNFSTVFTFTTTAGTFAADSTADAVDANPGDSLCATVAGDCTLRAAIQEANAATGSQIGVIITLPAGTYTLTIPGADDTAQMGDLDLTSDVVVEGDGEGATVIDGNSTVVNDRVFHVHSQAAVTISGVTVTGGRAPDGGGIYNQGVLTVTQSTLSANEATGTVLAGGGGAYNTGKLLLDDVWVIGNTSGDRGGGVYTYNSTGDLTIRASTISGNEGVYGGGVFGESSPILVEDSTVSGNTATVQGGGLWMLFNSLTINRTTIANNAAAKGGGLLTDSANLALNNSTLSGNSAAEGGAINNQSYEAGGWEISNSTIINNSASASIGGVRHWGYYATPIIRNSVLAENGDDCFGYMSSEGYNILGNDNPYCDMTVATGDQIGTPDNPIDPLLRPLQNNGGPTLTHAPLPGSLILDNGNPDGCLDDAGNVLITDQRGFPRPLDSDGNGTIICDVGAYESDGQDFAITVSPASQSICQPAAAVYDVTLTEVGGFTAEATLSASGHPAGTTATFDPNPASVPGGSSLTIDNMGAAITGTYLITISAMADTGNDSGSDFPLPTIFHHPHDGSDPLRS